jgi:hypothetical protein
MKHRIVNRVMWIGLTALFLSFPATASAQGDGMIIIAGILGELHKSVDFSLGFSMANTTNTPDSGREIPIGAQFGMSGRRKISAEVELALQSRSSNEQRSSFNMFEYLFGPRFSSNNGRRTVYGHILAGGVHQWEGGTLEESPEGGAEWKDSSYDAGGFAMALGGGLDVDVNDKIAIRVAQFDWIPILQDGSWIAGTMSFGCGVVIRSKR